MDARASLRRGRSQAAWRGRLIAALVVASLPLAAATTHLTIVHTNDIHDHVRPGAESVGGIAYVAGYVASMRAAEPGLIVVDAGDVTEKGDLVAFRTHGLLTYEAMRSIGYDGVAIGNHDYDAGFAWLRRYGETLGQPLLCLNAVVPPGESAPAASRMIVRHGLKIALLGVLVPQDSGTLDFAASGRRLASEAAAMDREAALVVAICHAGPAACVEWARRAPAVDLFISGHTHEQLAPAVFVRETGAWIVQAGSYARQVGRVDIDLDPVSERIVHFQSAIVAMNHAEVRPHAEVARLVYDAERRLCPEAGHIVATASAAVGPEIAWLAADALRAAAGADFACCSPEYIVRDGIPAGPVDVNALFLTGGQRGAETVLARLSGSEINAYLNALEANPKEQTAWAGLAARRNANATGPRLALTCDLGRNYTVIMPAMEWRKRFLRAADRMRRADPANPLARRAFSSEPSDITYVNALVRHLQPLPPAERDLRLLTDAALAAARP